MDNQSFEELLIKELSGEINEAERRQLTELLNTEPGWRKEYEIFKDYWAKKETALPDTRSVFEKVKEKIKAEEKDVKTLPRRRYLWQSAAAVLILGLGTLAYRYFTTRSASSHLEWQEKYAASRTRSRIMLSDGSTIMLNADTRLRFPTSFDGASREVYLTGEAFFDIQKDPLHPFIIHTDKMDIRVLGTSFNVRSYPGDPAMETTLIKGSIEVTFPDRPSDRIILKPNDKLVIANHLSDSATTIPAPNNKTNNPVPQPKYTLTGLTHFPKQDSIVTETSWVDNKLAFSSEAFQDLARDMERWYGVKIVFDNPGLAHYPFTGIFQKESITEALYALQLSEKFQYTIRDGIIHIY